MQILQSLKRSVKSSLSLLPGPLDRLSAQVLYQSGFATLAYRSFVKAHRPLSITEGPFKDMAYMSEAVGSALYPKIVGSYELELHSPLEQIISSPHDVLVNIGSAEGYYSVGLALRMPQLTSYGFDIEDRAATLQGTLARLNKVSDRVHALGPKQCQASFAEEKLSQAKNPLILCDCEGAEESWLDFEALPSLEQSTVLVELHDCFVPGLSEKIRSRFDKTHRIAEFSAKKRTIADFQDKRFEALSVFEKVALMDEGRDPKQRWYFMTPK
ncbi:MAG: hypothetical protein P1V97_17180 [Planctomycetota bacterium]|nr:hypothetical protein [Planctomycetota bacterium]